MPIKTDLPKGVMLNAYPDSIGQNMTDIVGMLKRPEFNDVFSLFYILPTVFNSDLDRGFSIIDYDLNDDLVSREDLEELHKLNILFKFDLVLNHLSVGSPQFQDLLKHGDKSKYKDFFIDWNEFWRSHGEMGPDGYVIPHAEHLDKLFMRKPGFPILKVRFPDGSDRPYWNTFYQQVNYPEITTQGLLRELGKEKLKHEDAEKITALANDALIAKRDINKIDLGNLSHLKDDVVSVVEQNRQYLGQMDLNAQSQEVWDFYDETFKKLRDHGGKLVRLDAFAYLHKQPGEINFFNKPGTWKYLARVKRIADKYDLILLPEIHSEYGHGLHEEVAAKGFPIYDFFFPGLVIHALERGTNRNLLHWIDEIIEKNIKTINMLGCHDGIPLLDLKGNNHAGVSTEGLLSNEEIDTVIESIMDRGGRVKNLYGPDGKKISYYQVNATFFSALGEDERKLRLARAIQMFMPGIPQVWYLDLFAGKNDYAAADKGSTAGHKEINRTTLTNNDIEQGLKQTVVRDQLDLMRLRNTSPAFDGELTVSSTDEHCLHLTWKYQECAVTLNADLRDYSFSITHKKNAHDENVMSYS
ncbi:MAG: glycosidase [endosymbiont of Seepiophila jonesi]|uniref:Glycosidase n=1 Tax=endosymbiont of Lamellibrachia luymesi TaxID=2200907 RepID=A0A370DFT0_9GAMM|nr:MAG: glycosidase [endosymbiont of Lamellibrachia luymesi]RDH93764.1 MAG: glycosidase [endosymbiont of Seepiophila jonesi]